MWLITVCLFIMFLVKVLVSSQRPKKFPPGPRALPVIGHLLQIKRLKEETKLSGAMYCKLAEKYGSVVGLRLGPFSKPLIIVSGKDAIFEMLSRPEFDGRQHEFVFQHRTNDIRAGVSFTDGQIWGDNRRFALKTLRNFGFGKLSMEGLILEDAISIVNVIRKISVKGPIESICDITYPVLINSLWYIVSGQRYELNNENPKLQHIFHIIQENFKTNVSNSALLNRFPFLLHLVPSYSAWDKRVRQLWTFFATEVSMHRKNRSGYEIDNLIDAYLKEMDQQNSSSFNEGQLTALIQDLFIASLETTNNNIGFLVTLLTVRQDIQKNVHDEIDQVIGKDILPSITLKNRFPYLNATLAEVMRFTNVTPTTIPHRAMTDTIFRGYEIKKNYNLVGNFVSLHMDEDHWGDPQVFRPERFINANGEFFEDPWLVPFGAGRRRCLGETLARSTFFLFAACLFQNLHFVLPPGEPKPSLAGVDGFTVSPPKIKITALER